MEKEQVSKAMGSTLVKGSSGDVVGEWNIHAARQAKGRVEIVFEMGMRGNGEVRGLQGIVVTAVSRRLHIPLSRTR
jgi:hypothetical protein